MAEQPIKYFTVEQANEALPYVRRIVEDIVAEYESWQAQIRRYEALTEDVEPVKETEEQTALRRDVDDIAKRISRYIDELSAVGCVFKGFDGGLVDFHSQRGGRDVFLCWKLGEESVAHWHTIEGGFAGRQALVPTSGDEDTESCA